MRDMGNQLSIAERLAAAVPPPSPSGPRFESVVLPDQGYARFTAREYHNRNRLNLLKSKGKRP